MPASSVGSGARSPLEPILGALLDALPEREPEAIAALGTLLHVGLRLSLLLARERLRVREAYAPAALLDREHEHLDLASLGKGFALIGAAAHGELRRGHEPGLAGSEANEDAERFVAIDRPGEHRAHRDTRRHLLPQLGALGRQRERDPALVPVDADDQHGDFRAVGRGFAHRALP